jgi:hypothetical protein
MKISKLKQLKQKFIRGASQILQSVLWSSNQANVVSCSLTRVDSSQLGYSVIPMSAYAYICDKQIGSCIHC